MTQRRNPGFYTFRAFWVGLAAASLLNVGGCSHAQPHGYELHGDMRVEHQPGPLGFSTHS